MSVMMFGFVPGSWFWTVATSHNLFCHWDMAVELTRHLMIGFVARIMSVL
jgi:hypothetical protein